MSMSYVYSFLNIETTLHEVEVEVQFEFLIFPLFKQLICPVISKLNYSTCLFMETLNNKKK